MQFIKNGVAFGKEQLETWVILHLTLDLHPVTLNNIHFGEDAYLWRDLIKIYKKKKRSVSLSMQNIISCGYAL